MTKYSFLPHFRLITIFFLHTDFLPNCFPELLTGVFRTGSLWKVKMDWLQDSCRWWVLSDILQEHATLIPMFLWKLRHHIPPKWHSVIADDDSSHPPLWEPQFLQFQVMHYHRICSQHTVRHLYTCVAIQLWSSGRRKCIIQICIANSAVQVPFLMALEITTS